MKRFLVRDNNFCFFFTCIGDENNLCDRCEVRFACYTGEYIIIKHEMRCTINSTIAKVIGVSESHENRCVAQSG